MEKDSLVNRNSIKITHPDISKQWDYKKNKISIDNISYGSDKKVWWVCDKGHSFEQRVNKRTLSGNKCPYCSGNKILSGFNDISTTHPGLLKCWDYEKNEIEVDKVSSGSHKKYWWVCDKGHSYLQSVVNKAIKNRGCPYCSNQKILFGYNDLFTTHTEIVEKYWDYENNIITPKEITYGSGKKVWWKCDKCKQSYQMSPYSKINGKRGCPICRGLKIIEGFNDLTTTHPEVVKFWDYDKNIILPTQVTSGTNKKYWWVCDKGHSFQQSPNSKLNSSLGGCPYCTNTKALEGFNDLVTTHSEILKYWDYDKNKILPTELTYGSDKKINFKCDKGHQYLIRVKNFTQSPECSQCNMYGVSKSEKEVFNYVKSLLPDIEVLENSRNVLKNSELDIYIPEKKIAIEFNGLYWHTENQGKGKWYHYNKWKECVDNNIQLITVWEDDWFYKKEIVKKMLARKLHASKEPKVAARKTFVDMISKDEAISFCETNHIQGFNLGTYYIGLRNKKDNNLVAVSIWRKNKKDIYLDRYCTSQIVQGGMGKLLKHALRIFENDGFTQLITFADHAISDGGLYERLGFIKDSELKPDYSYYYNNKRRHKFGFRKKRFKNDSDLLYQDNMTEKELADLNEIYRIWDCGKDKYVLNI